MRTEGENDAAHDEKLAALEQAGHPVVRIVDEIDRPYRPGVFPLRDGDGGRRRSPRHQSVQPAGRRGRQDQDPRVDRSLREDRRTACGEAGGLRPTGPIFTPTSTMPLRCARPAPTATLGSWLKAHLARSRRGDYVALLAYIERDDGHHRRAAADAACGARQAPRRDLRRIRPALPAFDRASLQGRARQRRVPADHRRRRQGSAGAGPEGEFRRHQGGAGARRFRRADRARPARVARASQGRAGSRCGLEARSKRCDHRMALVRNIKENGIRNAARHDRLGADGRQHRPPADEAMDIRPSVYDKDPKAVAALAADGAVGAGYAGRIRPQAGKAAHRLGDAAGRQDHRSDDRRAVENACSRTTSSSTAATPSGRTTSAAARR